MMVSIFSPFTLIGGLVGFLIGLFGMFFFVEGPLLLNKSYIGMWIGLLLGGVSGALLENPRARPVVVLFWAVMLLLILIILNWENLIFWTEY